jgi:WhiB family transcriptional regulator, redox-sensing transcriptional regulator
MTTYRVDLHPERAVTAVAEPLLTAEDRAAANWRSRSACRDADPDLFFSVVPADVAAAKAVCAGCPVRENCLEFALEHGERHGTWGGMDEDERPAARIIRLVPAPAPQSRDARLSALLPQLQADEVARFLAKIAPGGCGLTWTAQLGDDGSGIFRVTRGGVRRPYRAHRLAYLLATGTDPGPDTVIQACGDHACVTPRCLQIEPVSETRLRTAQQRKSA